MASFKPLNLGPKRPPMLSHSLNKPPLAPLPAMSLPKPTTDTTRKCSQCPRMVSAAQKFKMCGLCREKSKEHSKRRAERKRAEEVASLGRKMGEDDSSDKGGMQSFADRMKLHAAVVRMQETVKPSPAQSVSAGKKRSLEIDDSAESISARANNKKRPFGPIDFTVSKKPKTLRPVETISAGVTHNRMLIPSDFASKSNEQAQTPSARPKQSFLLSTAGGTSTEYQTSKELYDTLAACSNGPVTFSGCYAIVSTATPAVTLSRRAELVARELRDKLKACGVHSFRERSGKDGGHNTLSQDVGFGL
ncbi:hypothetical protein HWV62_5419 [Athelia sp. TMB]|nr:hypothetical protein HWV62_5419 [Athelia sp. TMB]